jgi:hypothetical protein
MDWTLPEGTRQPNGSRIHSWESIHTALLMDIRDELKAANAETSERVASLHQLSAHSFEARSDRAEHGEEEKGRQSATPYLT